MPIILPRLQNLSSGPQPSSLRKPGLTVRSAYENSGYTKLTFDSDEILNVVALAFTSIVPCRWNRDHCRANLITSNWTLVILDGLAWSIFAVASLEEVSSLVAGDVATATSVSELPVSLRSTRAKLGRLAHGGVLRTNKTRSGSPSR